MEGVVKVSVSVVVGGVVKVSVEDSTGVEEEVSVVGGSVVVASDSVGVVDS